MHEPGSAEAELQNSYLRRQIFDTIFAPVVLTNSVFIGVEVELGLSGVPRPTVIQAFQYTCTILFTIELLIRAAAYGRQLFCARDWTWSLLDAFIVSTSLYEMVLELSQESSDSSGEVANREPRQVPAVRARGVGNRQKPTITAHPDLHGQNEDALCGGLTTAPGLYPGLMSQCPKVRVCTCMVWQKLRPRAGFRIHRLSK